MRMGDVEIGNLSPLDASTLQLTQYAIATPGIHQQMFTAAACQDKTGIKALRDQRTTGPQHRDFILHHL